MSGDEIENQAINKNSKITQFDKYLNKVSKSICKIICKNLLGTGFLIKLYKDEKELYCLITNEHVINKKMIESKEIIDVNYKYEEKWIKIKLDITQRLIKYDSDKDFTIIEIIKDDKIKEKYFLLPNLNKIDYINEDIYIFQYPDGENLSSSEGKIKGIDNFKFYYDASTKKGSSGGPIFLKNDTKVIGIHKGLNKTKKINQGIPIYLIIELLQSEKENNEIKEQLIETEIFENNEYYFGQTLNGKKHGQGKILDQFGNDLYVGEFKNGEKEGIGTYYYSSGEYYYGNWLKGKRQGKGIIYSKFGVIIYEGDFFNDKIEGEGNYIDYNGKYYIGQFKNNKMNGKGKCFYKKDGKLEYEGDFIDGKKEGEGKYIYENDDYYEGQFKNDKMHGKGILYDRDKNKLYEGDFSDGKKHGKGKLYYKNGNVEYEGDFKNDKEEGDGVYFEENGNYYIGNFLDGKKNGNGILFDKNGIIINANNFDNN